MKYLLKTRVSYIRTRAPPDMSSSGTELTKHEQDLDVLSNL